MFLTAIALGLASAATRSPGALVLSGLMVPIVFAAACLASPVALPVTGLLTAILGFNVGAAMLLAGHILYKIRRRVA